MSGSISAYQEPPVYNGVGYTPSWTTGGYNAPAIGSNTTLSPAIWPSTPTLTGGGKTSISIQAPIDGGGTQLDQSPTSQNTGSIPISSLMVQDMPLTFIPNVSDPTGTTGTILVPGGNGMLYEVPANTAGQAGRGGYEPALPDTSLGVFVLQNEAAQNTGGFNIPAATLVSALSGVLGYAAGAATGSPLVGTGALIATNILGNIAAQGMIHVPYNNAALMATPASAVGGGPL